MSETNGKGPSETHVMEQKVTKEIPFKLSAEEKNKMADRAAELSRERDAKVDELKKISKSMREEIKAAQKEIDRLLDAHMKGAEAREVEITERMDWDNKTVQHYHEGKMIMEREMIESELQMKLDPNGTRKVVKEKKDKRTKAQKNPDLNLTPEELKSREIAEVHSMETRRATKKSAVDEQGLN